MLPVTAALVPVRQELVLRRAEMLACARGPLVSRGESPTSAGVRRVCRGVPPMCCPGLKRVSPELLVCWPAAVIVANDLVVVRAELQGVRRVRRAATPELALCTCV